MRMDTSNWYKAPELLLPYEEYNEQVDTWSVGCIFAELLQMLPPFPFQDRGPLFPSSTLLLCSKIDQGQSRLQQIAQSYFEQKHVQHLQTVFECLGKPSDADSRHLSTSVQQLIRTFKSKGHLRSKFSFAPKEAVDILSSMLEFNPRKRISIADAWKQPLFETYREPEKEGRGDQTVQASLGEYVEALLGQDVTPRLDETAVDEELQRVLQNCNLHANESSGL